MYDLKLAGERMRARRRSLGLSQHDLAERLSVASRQTVYVSGQTVSRWERGVHHVALRYRRALCAALEVPHGSLFED